MRSLGWGSNQTGLASLEEEKPEIGGFLSVSLSLGVLTGKAAGGHPEKGGPCKPERGVSPEPNRASTLSLKFYPPEL